MAPEARASLAELSRLRRELAEDRAAMGSRAEELQEALLGWSGATTAKPLLAYAAVALHAWYTALETGLERIARAIDDDVPEGERSHRDLLSQMMTEIPEIRPRVLPAELTSDLLALLSFRHFFRHAYAVALDPEKLAHEVNRALRIASTIDSQLDAFDVVLEQAERALLSPTAR